MTQNFANVPVVVNGQVWWMPSMGPARKPVGTGPGSDASQLHRPGRSAHRWGPYRCHETRTSGRSRRSAVPTMPLYNCAFTHAADREDNLGGLAFVTSRQTGMWSGRNVLPLTGQCAGQTVFIHFPVRDIRRKSLCHFSRLFSGTAR